MRVPINHFRVVSSLGFKARPSAKPLMILSHANETHFHTKVLVALSLVLNVRVFRTRKWPIHTQKQPSSRCGSILCLRPTCTSQFIHTYSCSTFSTQPDFIAFDKDWNHAQPAMSLSISLLVEPGSLRDMENLESHVI